MKQSLLALEPTVQEEEIISDLWSKPIDEVFSTHKIPKEIASIYYQEIAALLFRKILVTTGLRELQMAKINALGIESDFEMIYIDDPREKPRRHKINIFNEILNETQQRPQEIWVIGDNPESEMKAGKALNMNTIQRKSSSKKSSQYSDYEIDSFEELKEIIN